MEKRKESLTILNKKFQMMWNMRNQQVDKYQSEIHFEEDGCVFLRQQPYK